MRHDDCRYPQALEGYFAMIDAGAGFRVPRHFPRLGPVLYSYMAFRARKDPVIYNTEVAPHNLEGGLIGLGDAFLKQGKIAKARMVYKSIPRCPNYPNWKYKHHLQTRLANLEVLRDKFRADSGNLDVSEPAMFFQSSFSCTGCHAR
jgi:hypothetical protein